MAFGDPHNYLAVGKFGQLSERLSRLRHDINGCLSVIVGATEIMQMKPDPETARKWLPRIADQPARITQMMKEYSTHFEQHGTLMDQLSLLLPRLVKEDQKQSAKALMNSQQEAIGRLETELAAARKLAREAAVTQPLQEEAVRKHASEAARIEVELTLLRARVLASLQPPLDDHQREQLLRSCEP
jgi:alkylation response protein AidB-like acyl-CoA dehydrogenase